MLDKDIKALGVTAALEWLKRHPGRDALDAATAAICNDGAPSKPLVEKYATLNANWPEFLEAVKRACA